MQTFLTSHDFTRIAITLDDKHLSKQRLEAWHLLEIISGQKADSKWRNHPVVRMWWGYDATLRNYGIILCNYWRKRGHSDSMLQKFQRYAADCYTTPWWLFSRELHLSHQSCLVRNDPEYYRKFFPKVPDDLPCLWPQSKLLDGTYNESFKGIII